MIKEKSVKLQDNSEVRLTVTVPKEDILVAYNDLVADYCQKAQIPGFRKGKVPPEVMIRKFGDVLLEETEQNVVKKGFDEALEGVEKKPLPYSMPYIVDDHDKQKAEGKEDEHAPISLDRDFTFTIAYDIYPDIEIGEYRGIEVEKPSCEITDDDIERELKALQEQNALVVEKKDGVAEKGNIVTISYVELDETGAERRGTKREGFSFEIGTGYNLYALDEDVTGMKVGDEKIVDKTFPEDYQHKELAGKTVKIKTQVTSLKEKSLPTIDDDLAQDINDKFETLEDLKKDIRDRLEETATAAVRSRMIARILDSLYQSSTVAVPRSMINLQLASNWQTLLQQLRGDERAAERYLRAMGRTREAMLDQWKPDAERRLKSSLIMATVMDREKIEVADEDVAARVKEIAERRGSSEEEVRDRIEQENAMDDVKSQIRERKLEELLLSVATVKPGSAMSFLDLVQGNQ